MQSAVISLSPSFGGHSGRFLDVSADLIAAHPLPEDEDVYDLPQEEEEEEEEAYNGCDRCGGNAEEDEEDDDDFEFGGLVSSADDFDAISADELFANGRMRPLFEVFQSWPAGSIPVPSSAAQSDLSSSSSSSACSSSSTSTRLPLKTLFLEDRAVPEADELTGVPEGTYCVWSPRKPQPETCKKSNSTSNSSRRWRLRDILHRSNSDGKDMFVFLAPPPKKNKDRQAPESRPRRPPASPERVEPQKKMEKDKNMADRKTNQKKGGFPADVRYVKSREGDRRRSYLPYRQDLVGIFGNLNLHHHQHH
ncbi:uncharacterized protein LOC116259901 [Nymphaea colorata]|uniref:Uncharacterized protein n=1 Tax=Nymphaea colorata TaxID=210225 RepID=A0A5K1GV67_9MAGN|nr:uncharacterized protein LOC116259901 [Nymphaea colorata]